MSQVTRTFCDICSAEFTDPYWDSAPCHVTLQMSAPAQHYDCKDMEHVCRKCRERIADAFRAPVRVVAPPHPGREEENNQ
jgi:hypothetical protein